MQVYHLVQNTILSFCLINEELNPNRTVLRYDSSPFPTIWYPGTAETLSDHSPSPCEERKQRYVLPSIGSQMANHTAATFKAQPSIWTHDVSYEKSLNQSLQGSMTHNTLAFGGR